MMAHRMTFFLFFSVIRISHPKPMEFDMESEEKEALGFALQAGYFTTVIPKLNENDLQGRMNEDFFDNLQERYATDTHMQNAQAGSNTRAANAKRRWADNSMSVWGKRQDLGHTQRSSPYRRKMWSDNSMAVWGKRTNDGTDFPGNLVGSGTGNNLESQGSVDFEFERHPNIDNPEFLKNGADDKRRWAENSMSVWGKRTHKNDVQDFEVGSQMNNSQQLYPKYLAENHSVSNGQPTQKQRLLQQIIQKINRELKRNWATNTMNVWGKRENAQKKTL